MTESANRQPIDEELDWLAFGYVSGDLDEGAQRAFDDRLAVDQSAREAVALAVELFQAVAVAETHPERVVQATCESRRGLSWSRRAAWMSLGAVAALVLAMVWSQWGQIRSWITPVSSARQELAEVWSQTRESVREIVQIERLDPIPVDDVDPLPNDAIPSWMTAALGASLHRSEPDPDHESFDES